MSQASGPLIAGMTLLGLGWYYCSTPTQQPNEEPKPVFSTMPYKSPAQQHAENKKHREDGHRLRQQTGLRTWNGRVLLEDEFEIIERDVKMEHGMSFEDALHGEDF